MPYRIHPGIGVGRVGDSPEWFVGPETSDEPLPPAGHYKDSECRFKRQAAHFRVYEYDLAGNPLGEVAGATITWTVSVGRGTSLSTNSVTGVSPTSTLPSPGAGLPSFGELQMQADGRLLVLSGIIDSSFDGVCDGPVQASVLALGASTPEDARPAWVVIAPPDFSPAVRPVQSVYDRIFDAHHVVWGIPSPSPPSLVRDIYPIIRAARDVGYASFSDADVPTMTSADRAHVITQLHVMTGEPFTSDITATQNELLQAWVAGTFTNDWGMVGTPTPETPATLDRGPIDHCLRAFLSAWDFGTNIPGPSAMYLDPFRFDPSHPTVVPGFIRTGLAAWQGDLLDCFGEWPAQVPYAIIASGWFQCGFLVRSGGTSHVIDRGPFVSLANSSVDFGAVAQGPGGTPRQESAAIRLYVDSGDCPLTIEVVTPLPPGLSTLTPTVTVNGSALPLAIYVTYETGAVGSALPPGTTVQLRTRYQTLSVNVQGRTIAPRTTQVALVLDCSFSMTDLRADGSTKLLGMQQAVDVMIGVARPGDAFALAPFSTTALATTPMTPLDVAGVARTSLHNQVFALAAVADTSIGAGINSGRSLLEPTGYDQSAIVVVTDGKENTAPLIASAVSSLDTRTFAVGIGTYADVNYESLRAIAAEHDGSLVLTGDIIGGANQFALEKYFIQILSEATNDHVLADPYLTIYPGMEARVPFLVSEVDRSIDGILVTRQPERLEVALLAPDGTLIEPSSLGSVAGLNYTRKGQLIFYRLALPAPLAVGHALGPGLWQLVVRSAKKTLGPSVDSIAASAAAFERSAVPCFALVTAVSDLRLRLTMAQPSPVVTRPLLFEAWLTYTGIPLAGSVAVEVRGPREQLVSVPLEATEPGRFVGSYQPIAPGLYRTLLRATGTTPRGYPFQREYAGTFGVFANDATAQANASPLPPQSHCPKCHLGAGCCCHPIGRTLARALVRLRREASRLCRSSAPPSKSR